MLWCLVLSQGPLPGVLALALQPAAADLQAWKQAWAVLRNLCTVPVHATPALLEAKSFLSDTHWLLQQLLQRKDGSRMAPVFAALTDLAANEAGQRQLLQSGAPCCISFSSSDPRQQHARPLGS